MKILSFLSIALLLFSLETQAQLKVGNNGYVSTGTSSTPYPFFAHGGISAFNWANAEVMLKPNNGGRSDFGSSTGYINFWYPSPSPGGTWNRLIASQFQNGSDQRLKKNISDAGKTLELVLKLHPKKYQFKDSLSTNKNYIYGFIAQDILVDIPSIVDTSDTAHYSMDYIQIIPLLTGAVQEQHATIDSLISTTDSLKSLITTIQNTCCTQQNRIIAPPPMTDSLIQQIKQLKEELNYLKENCCRSSLADPKPSGEFLSQNIPNPFDGTTTIPFSLFNKYKDCYIKIHTLNGEELKSFRVSNEDKQITVNLQDLKSGIYLYSLICDGNLIDSKKMILSK